MVAHWRVPRQAKIDGKWKDRPLDAIADDLEAAVCDAALRWEHPTHERQESGISEEVPTKKAKTHGAAEHVTASLGINAEVHTKEADAYGAAEHVTATVSYTHLTLPTKRIV